MTVFLLGSVRRRFALREIVTQTCHGNCKISLLFLFSEKHTCKLIAQSMQVSLFSKAYPCWSAEFRLLCMSELLFLITIEYVNRTPYPVFLFSAHVNTLVGVVNYIWTENIWPV